MSYLILKHLTSQQLPPEWARNLPVGQTFTVSIVSENAGHQPSSAEHAVKNKNMYTYLRQWKENFFDPS